MATFRMKMLVVEKIMRNIFRKSNTFFQLVNASFGRSITFSITPLLPPRGWKTKRNEGNMAENRGGME